MKKFLLLTMLILGLSVQAWAYDFVEGGIYYNINDDGTVEVTYGGSSASAGTDTYTGDIVVPSTVTHEGVTYAVTSIGASAFRSNSELLSVYLPSSITYVAERAFQASSVITITFEENANLVSFGGTYTFYGCEALESITLPSNMPTIVNQMFRGCKSLEKLEIPETVTSIEDRAFYDTGLKSIVIPDNVITIGTASTGSNGGVLRNCTSLEEAVIGDAVTTVEYQMFYGDTSLKKVTFGKSCEKIGSACFNSCTALEEIIMKCPVPPTAAYNSTSPDATFFKDVPETCVLYVPEGCKEAYEAADVWSTLTIVEVTEGAEDNSYKFVCTDWGSIDTGRVTDANVTYDTASNTITVNAGTGANNVALSNGREAPYTTASYIVTNEQHWFIVVGTNLSTAENASKLWWMNGENNGEIDPTTVETLSDGQVLVAWDLTTTPIDGGLMAAENLLDGWTGFGLTSTTGTSVISDICFYTLEEAIEAYPELSGELHDATPYEFVCTDWGSIDTGRVTDANVTYDTEANTITVNAGTGANNVALSNGREAPFTTANMTVTNLQCWYTVVGTNLSTASGDSKLWWMNGANWGEWDPTEVVELGDGQVLVTWDLSTMTEIDVNLQNDENNLNGWTGFGLTSTTGTSVISDINFYTDEELQEIIDSNTEPGIVEPEDVDSDYHTGDVIEAQDGKSYTVLGENLVQNHSFELGYEGWTSANDFTSEITSTYFKLVTAESDPDQVSGDQYLVGTGWGGSSSDRSLGTAWPIEEGKTYYFSYNIKNLSNAEETTYLKTSLTNNPGDETEELGYPASVSADWQTVEYVFDSKTYDYVQIKFRWLATETGVEQWGFDNFQIYEVEEVEIPAEVIHDETTFAHWSIAPTDGGTFQYNTWSTEDDPSGMKTPFIEYWVGSGNRLGDATISHQTLTELAQGYYVVSMDMRAFNENSLNKIEPGIVLSANGTSVDVSLGTHDVFNKVSAEAYGTYEVPCLVGEDGTLDIAITLTDANCDWLAFKNVKVTYMGTEYELPAVDEVTAVEGDMSIAKNEAQQAAIAAYAASQTPATAIDLYQALTDAQLCANFYADVAATLEELDLDEAGQAAWAATENGAAYEAKTLEYCDMTDTYVTAVKAQTTAGSDMTYVVLYDGDWTGNTGTYLTGVERYGDEIEVEDETVKVLYKTIEDLTPGTYEVTFYAVANNAWVGAAYGEGIAQVFANETTEAVTVYDQTGFSDLSVYSHTLTCTVDNDGVLEFGLQNVATGGNWYVAEAVSLTLVEVEITVDGNDNDYAVGDEVEIDGVTYAVVSDNMFVNGGFGDDVNDWTGSDYVTAADPDDFTLNATGGYNDGEYLTIASSSTGGGQGPGTTTTVNNLTQSIQIESGKTYLFVGYTTGGTTTGGGGPNQSTTTSGLNQMSDATTEVTQSSGGQGPGGQTTTAVAYVTLEWGSTTPGQQSTGWTQTLAVFTAETPYAGMHLARSGSYDGFQLYEVEEVVEINDNEYADGDVAEIDGIEYAVVSDNMVVNGGFDDGVDGWTAGDGTDNYVTAADPDNFTLETEGGFNDGAYITIPSTVGGYSSVSSPTQAIAVEEGKTYLFIGYTKGTTPTERNQAYNALVQMSDAYNEVVTSGHDAIVEVQLLWGAEEGETAEEWTKTEGIFTATTPYVGVRFSWCGDASFDGIQLYEVESAEVEPEPTPGEPVDWLAHSEEAEFDHWTTTGNNGSFQYNDWSTESDASGMTTPFIENWVYAENDTPLTAATISHNTLVGLPAGDYTVSLDIRILNELEENVTTGTTFNANGVSVDLVEAGKSATYDDYYPEVYGTYTVECEVGDDGLLDISIEIPSNATYNWIAFKNLDVTIHADSTPVVTAFEGLMAADAREAMEAAIAAYNANPSESLFTAAIDAIQDASQATEEYAEIMALVEALDEAGRAAWDETASGIAYNNGTLSANADYTADMATAQKAQTTEGSDMTFVVLYDGTWIGQTGTYSTGVEIYGGNSTNFPVGKVLYKQIEGMQPGNYTVTFYAVASAAQWEAGGVTYGSNIAQVFVNDVTEDVDIISQYACTPSDYEYTMTGTVGSDGILEFGLQNIAEGGNWYVGQAISMTLGGEVTPSERKGDYEFINEDWVSLDLGRVSESDISYNIADNTITVNAGTGKNNVALGNSLSYSADGTITTADYTVGSSQNWFIVVGTDLSYADGDSYLWWMNGFNDASSVAPTYLGMMEDGQVLFAWDLTESTMGTNLQESLNYLNGWTGFGLTSTSGTSVISDISFYTWDDAVAKYPDLTDIATGIKSVGADVEAEGIYTLSGMRLSKITKSGIYIIDGKKVLVK